MSAYARCGNSALREQLQRMLQCVLQWRLQCVLQCVLPRMLPRMLQRMVQRTVRRMESARIAAAWRTWAAAVDVHRETLRCGRIVKRVDCPEGVCVADIATGY